MSEVYCELNDAWAESKGLPKYVSYHFNPTSSNLLWELRHEILVSSERAWVQYDHGTVKWVKNSTIIDLQQAVDLKEFVWIKLKCLTI